MIGSVIIVLGLSKVVVLLTQFKVLKDMSFMRVHFNKHNKSWLK